MSADAGPAAVRTPALLILFDIDGTLLQGASLAHARALHRALIEVFDAHDTHDHRVEAAGRTDLEIARDLLGRSGVTAATIDALAGALADAWLRAYTDLCEPDLSDTVSPGMRELLDDLAVRDDVRLALLTGNLEPIARLKLDRAGIGHHFPVGQGAFGSDAEDRTLLPAIARGRAGFAGRGDGPRVADGEGSPGAAWPRERTLLVGDTPRDIACARADGVRVFAVSTGPFAAEQLAVADSVAAGAGDLAVLIEAELSRE